MPRCFVDRKNLHDQNQLRPLGFNETRDLPDSIIKNSPKSDLVNFLVLAQLLKVARCCCLRLTYVGIGFLAEILARVEIL